MENTCTFFYHVSFSLPACFTRLIFVNNILFSIYYYYVSMVGILLYLLFNHRIIVEYKVSCLIQYKCVSGVPETHFRCNIHCKKFFLFLSSLQNIKLFKFFFNEPTFLVLNNMQIFKVLESPFNQKLFNVSHYTMKTYNF